MTLKETTFQKLMMKLEINDNQTNSKDKEELNKKHLTYKGH